MGESNADYVCGYRKPPRHTQFAKGQSGNPKGRPKGSQNLNTIVAKVVRQRIRVTENGRSRWITKFEATMLQLINKAVSGDLKAISQLSYWIKALVESEQVPAVLPRLEDSDQAVLASIVERIRQSYAQGAVDPSSKAT
jgi:uncharacterized protein DUF5681